MSLCSNEMEGSSVLLVDLVAIEFNPSSGPQQHKHIIHPALSGGSEESSIKTVESSSLLNRGCGTQRIEAAHLALPSPSQALFNTLGMASSRALRLRSTAVRAASHAASSSRNFLARSALACADLSFSSSLFFSASRLSSSVGRRGSDKLV
eukprot:CAMPEP_0114176042 /NCGR_PEP_ID=MMETSP0043_2-20121206/37282_1 /TAXON_ID=464988 /ORGANISM="Hemiselmis andersenii, Strain CCMP644" /LENGTH=150 /DNA_ID=CAMNT_0001274327 /DNA_START=145 /DNA_END=598 /DNA_ORIENTATION=-